MIYMMNVPTASRCRCAIPTFELELTVDLFELDIQELYFEAPLPLAVVKLLDQAAATYGTHAAEQFLHQAYALAPTDLSVLVALYRFYYYQHRLTEALRVAHEALAACGQTIGLSADWTRLDAAGLAQALVQSAGLARFYLLALKGAGFLNLRLERRELACAMLDKIASLDPKDQLGAAALAEFARTTPVCA